MATSRRKPEGLDSVREEMNHRFGEVSSILHRLAESVEKFVSTREGFLALREQFIAHDKHDEERFERISSDLKEIKGAVMNTNAEEKKFSFRLGKVEAFIAIAMTAAGWAAAHFFGAN